MGTEDLQTLAHCLVACKKMPGVSKIGQVSPDTFPDGVTPLGILRFPGRQYLTGEVG